MNSLLNRMRENIRIPVSNDSLTDQPLHSQREPQAHRCLRIF
jgi:hypothetical protein